MNGCPQSAESNRTAPCCVWGAKMGVVSRSRGPKYHPALYLLDVDPSPKRGEIHYETNTENNKWTQRRMKTPKPNEPGMIVTSSKSTV